MVERGKGVGEMSVESRRVIYDVPVRQVSGGVRRLQRRDEYILNDRNLIHRYSRA